MDKVMRPKRLEYINVSGAGMQIHADLDSEFNMVEKRYLKGPHMIATEPWIQFSPAEWNDMVDQVFTEMVDLWNGKYASKK